MPGASWAQTSFLGGEISQTAQGRFDDPAYEIALNVCLNMIPLEAGALTRRPGTEHAGPTRGGAAGRVITFNHKQSASNSMEFTDGHLQFRQGAALVTTNDSVRVSSISTANPAVMTLASAVTWSSADRAFFSGLGTSCPLLQGRRFTLTKVDTTHFSLADELTGASIDGSTLGVGSLAASATINRVLDIATPWSAGAWASLRAVLADIPIQQGTTPGAVLLHAQVAPYVLEVTAAPTTSTFATFSLGAISFKDGPYLDPFTNGVQANPSALKGVITITLSFPAYDSGTAYPVGSFVTSSSVNYESLVDQNVGNTPVSSPSQWAPVSAGIAIGPGGFQGSDIGRLVRFFSEPDIWAVGTTYAQGAIVSYNPSGIPGANEYWQSLVGSNTGKVPGTDATNWQIATNNPAVWTWGKIVALANQISGTLAGSVNIGNMTGFGGLAAAFDGTTSKLAGACAVNTISIAPQATGTNDCYVGKNYSVSGAEAIQSVTIWPSSDQGFLGSSSPGTLGFISFTMNLRAKASAPASPSDGTLLGTATGNTGLPVNIVSNDTTTTWNYVWVELVAVFFNPTGGGGANPPPAMTVTQSTDVAQVQFFSASGSGVGNAASVEIIGPALLYSTPIRTWRLGLYSNTTGWPTVGTYHEDGRLWLFGVVANRADSSRSDDPFNFAPTDPNGSVPANAAISYVFNAKDVNPVLWAESDERGVLVGTQSAEWLISATTQNLPLSPTNVQAHPVTHYGSQNVEPRRAGGVLVFVQRFARKLLEFFPDVFSGRLTAPNLARDAKHLTKTGLAEIAYQSELAPIVWGRRNDGGLVGTTYKRENLMSSQGPSFNGWHRHTLGSGRTVESICAGPSTGGDLDALTMVTSNGTTRHVEVMTDLWEEGGDLVNAWFLDDAVAPSSFTADLTAQSITFNGLWHLNGATVTAFVAGVDAGDYTVANGSIVVKFDGTANSANGTSPLTLDVVQPYLASTVPAVIGYTYNSDGQVLRGGPQKNSGAANGPAAGKVSRAHQIAALLIDTCGGAYYQTTTTLGPAGIAFGSFFDKLDPLLKKADSTTIPAATLVNGVVWTPVDNPYTFDEGQLCWRMARPYPATIGWFSAYQMTQDQ